MKNPLNLPALILLLIIISAPLCSIAYTGEVLRSFAAPASHASGIAFDGKNLWLADRKTDLLYCIDPANGKVIRSIESPAYWTSALAWDGRYLWVADTYGGKDESEAYIGMIYKMDPATGTILKTLNAPTSHPTGLAWDGTYLWCVDDNADQLIRFSPEDGTTIQSYRSPFTEPHGLAFDGKYLWSCDRQLDEIHRIDPDNGRVILITPSPAPYPWGLTWDGENLWNADFETDMIYQLEVSDKEPYFRSKERPGKVVYTHQIKNFGPNKVITADIHISIPVGRANQELLRKPEFNMKPAGFVTDRWGQETALFHFEDLKAGETRTIEMTLPVKTWEVRYLIDPDKTGTLDDIPAEIKTLYLEDNDKFQVTHPVIQDAVKKVVGDEQNPYWIARKIFDHIIANMYYEMTGGWNTAPTVLERGNGSCSEYTFVFISMCRAAGLPARYVGSVVVRGDDASMDDVFHRWAEVYLPNYGWVPVDGSRGDRDWPRDQAHAIGYVPANLLITTQSGGGSETMEWTYNSNAFWTTEPKTYVNFTHFADWEPLEIKK